MRLWLPLFLHELLCQPSWQNGNFLTVLTPVRVWQGCDVNVSLADVPHETWHLHKFHLHHTDCKERICTEYIIDIYGGAFSVSYISSNSGSPLCSQHFRMNDLYRMVVNAGGERFHESQMNMNWCFGSVVLLYELHVWQEVGLAGPLRCWISWWISQWVTSIDLSSAQHHFRGTSLYASLSLPHCFTFSSVQDPARLILLH